MSVKKENKKNRIFDKLRVKWTREYEINSQEILTPFEEANQKDSGNPQDLLPPRGHTWKKKLSQVWTESYFLV